MALTEVFTEIATIIQLTLCLATGSIVVLATWWLATDYVARRGRDADEPEGS